MEESRRNYGMKSKQESDSKDKIAELDPYIDFECSMCKMTEKCQFSELKVADGYNTPMYFMRDPFSPPVRVKTRKAILSDFLVIGSTCTLCNQAICINKACSIYFGAHFCGNCVVRERRRFPSQVLEILRKAQEIEESAATQIK